MVIYEVNLTIQTAIFDDYLAWLKEHIVEMCKFEGFIRAIIFHVNSDDEMARQLRVQYEVASLKNLNNYLQYHAAGMREQAIKKFNDKFKAERKILEVLWQN